jgi:hypothetical protein
MKLISVNVGKPRPVAHEGRVVSTGIFKEPVAGPVFLRRLNLDGDGQADLRVHGGAGQFCREQNWTAAGDTNEKPPKGRLCYANSGFPLSRE